MPHSTSDSTSDRDANLQAIEELHRRLDQSARAGSDAAIARQHAKGKLTIPERLDRLFDPGVPRFEVGAFTAMGDYEEHGRIESAGVRTVVGKVSDRDCIVIANDSKVKSGTWFPLTNSRCVLRRGRRCSAVCSCSSSRGVASVHVHHLTGAEIRGGRQ